MLSKIEQLFVRACKVLDNDTRILKTYRRFYCAADTDEECIPHIINILAKIVDDNNLMTITKAIGEMDPYSVVFAHNGDYHEQWYRTLVSCIRHTQKTKFKGLETPAKFRNKQDTIDMVKGIKLFAFDELNVNNTFSEYCADAMIKQGSGKEKIYAYFDIIGHLAFPDNIAGEIVLMYKKDNALYCDLLVLDTPKGETLRLVHSITQYSIAAIGQRDPESNVSPNGLKLIGINITVQGPNKDGSNTIHSD